MQQLPTDLPSAHKEIINLQHKLLYVTEQLRMTRANLFGPSSERRAPEASPAQVLLFTPAQTPVEAKAPVKQKITYERNAKRQKVEGKLPEGTRFPAHLPREDEVVEEGEGEVAFEKITERLAAHPSAFYVKRIIRKIRRTAAGSLQSPAVPPAVLERTSVDVSFLAYVLVAKYVWHLPLYRQEQMLKVQGIEISRDTMIRYVIASAELCRPIYRVLQAELFKEKHLFGDETPVLVGRTKNEKKRFLKSWFWAFLGQHGAMFIYAPSRAFKEIELLLKDYTGSLQSDGYRVYETLSEKYPEITLVGCWAHVRRKFVDAEKGGNAPEASEALRYIRALYSVERWIREKELKPSEILRLRRRFSRKILMLFEPWLKKKAEDQAILPKCLFSVAVNYTRNRWDALLRYVEDPAFAIDSNAVEREIRPVALGKKNWLFSASEEGAEASAILYSLIASCRLAGVNVQDYFADILERVSTHPASAVHELLPINWKTLRQEELARREQENGAAAIPQVA